MADLKGPSVLNEPSRTYQHRIASAIGLTEAIILARIHYWCWVNKEKERWDTHYHDDHWWMYLKLDDWGKEFAHWTARNVRKYLSKLRKEGYVLTGHYSPNPSDRTLWYTVDDEAVERALNSYLRESGAPDAPPPDTTVANDTAVEGPTDTAVEDGPAPAVEDGYTVNNTVTTSVPNKRSNSRPNPSDEEDTSNLQSGAEVNSTVSATPTRVGKNNKKSAGPPAASEDFRFDPDDWQTQAASAFWDALARFDVLAKSHRTKGTDEVREEIDEWAYVFDKLHRLKEFSLDDLRLIYHWLFQNDEGEPQNWWIQQGNIQSARKLYQKNKEGIRYADYFLQKAKAELRNDPKIKKERARREEEQRYQDFIDSL